MYPLTLVTASTHAATCCCGRSRTTALSIAGARWIGTQSVLARWCRAGGSAAGRAHVKCGLCRLELRRTSLPWVVLLCAPALAATRPQDSKPQWQAHLVLLVPKVLDGLVVNQRVHHATSCLCLAIHPRWAGTGASAQGQAGNMRFLHQCRLPSRSRAVPDKHCWEAGADCRAQPGPQAERGLHVVEQTA